MKYEHIFEKIYRETHIVESRRKTTEEFIEEAKQIFPDYDYSKVNYVTNDTKIIVGCPKHGDFPTTPNRLLTGHGCKKCGIESRVRKQSSNTEEFIKKAKQIFPDYDYSKVNYITNDTKIIVGCPKHGDFPTTPHRLLNGHGCKKCGTDSQIKKVSSSTEEFIKKAKQIHPEYDYSKVNYVNYDTEIIIGCPKHGYVPTTPRLLFNGHGCKECGTESRVKKLSSNTEEFIKKAKQIFPDYDYSKVNYVSSDTKIIIGCPKHGDFPTTPNRLLSGRGCPTCSESKGERVVRDWLEEHNINYIRQHRFADLKSYPYDFYLPNFNLLIEYNGEQHYKEKPDFFHKSPGSFDGQLKRDRIKKEYAEKNGIELLVIPYWEFKNIDKILSIKLL